MGGSSVVAAELAVDVPQSRDPMAQLGLVPPLFPRDRPNPVTCAGRTFSLSSKAKKLLFCPGYLTVLPPRFGFLLALLILDFTPLFKAQFSHIRPNEKAAAPTMEQVGPFAAGPDW